MKNERITLSVALLIVAAVLLICILAVFISWLGMAPQVDTDHPARWIARDWGAIIGGLLATLAAGGTILAMRQQTEKTISEVRRQTAETVKATNAQSKEIGRQTDELRAVEGRREAREFAVEIRNFVQTLRHLHLRFVRRAVSAASAWKLDKKKSEFEYPIRSDFDFGLGRLPADSRESVSYTLVHLKEVLEVMQSRAFCEARLEEDLTGTLETWCKVDADVVRCIVYLERVALYIDRNDAIPIQLVTVDVSGGPGEKEFKAIVRDKQLFLALPRLFHHFNITPTKVDYYAGLIPVIDKVVDNAFN